VKSVKEDIEGKPSRDHELPLEPFSYSNHYALERPASG
jgi:hypothetical protein